MKRAAAPVLMFSMAVGLLLCSGTARADGFRCGRRLVSTGDHMLEVRKKCGDPDFVAQRIEKRKVRVKVIRWVVNHQEEVSEEQTVEVPVDEWTYDLGPERFIRFVTFENNRVVGVTTGGYGTRASTE
jgi:hypothetical protein